MITPFFRLVFVHAVWHAESYFPEVKVKVSRVQLSVPVDYTFPGILLARILQWVANIFIFQDQNVSIIINLSRVESKQSTMTSLIINQY